MERRNQIIEDNINILRQGIAVVERLDNHLYASPVAPYFRYGVGGHVRHCIDFYNRFLASFEMGKINYVLRERNPLVEVDRRLAISEIEAIIDDLERLAQVDLQQPVQVITEDASASVDGSSWSGSSLMRELQSLLSHTIHHYAIIALALRLQGVEPPAEFGVAPSTLVYWRQSA